MKRKVIKLCECGCKEKVSWFKDKKEWRKYIHGHNRKGKEGVKGRKAWNKGISPSLETKEKISKASRNRKCSEETRQKLSLFHKTRKRKPCSLNTKRKISKANKGYKHSFEAKEKITIFALKNRQNNSERQSQLWKDPNFIRKQMKARGVYPNKAELILSDILDNLFSNEYKYVGDGEFILAGKCPDFINVNGKKKIIELYGDYWHRNDDPQDRIKLFRQYGYDTLIIWEKELKNRNRLRQNLINFHESL